MRTVTEKQKPSPLANEGLHPESGNVETDSTSDYTTSEDSAQDIKLKATRLLWSLAEWHFSKCQPRDPAFLFHFRWFVFLICLEDELWQEALS